MSDGTLLSFSPLLPWPWLAGLGAAAALLGLYALLHGARGAWGRWGVLGLLGLALANPALLQERREPVKDVAALVLDESPSQSLGDRTARSERALAELEARLGGRDDLELRVVRAGKPATGEAATETRLFEALERTLADVPRPQRAGAVLITDGQVHDAPADPRRAAEYGPVHVLLSGSRDEADRRLLVTQAPSFGIVGKSVTLTFRVEDLPHPQSATAEITIRQDGGPPRVQRVPVGREISMDFPLTHGGQNVFELIAEPARRELTRANNRAGVMVNAVRDRLRVLLVSGEPYAGERTWRNMLKADAAVVPVHFTILRPPEKQDATPIRELSLITFPIRELFEVKLGDFDLIIFDRYRRRGVLPNIYLENIARHVERGGALLEVAGTTQASALGVAQTPLAAIMPAESAGLVLEQPFRPQITRTGRRHPVTAGLPGSEGEGTPAWGRWLLQNDMRASHGTVVMSGAGERPLLVLDRVGEGRVAQLASDQIWLWSRGFEGGGPHVELLRRLAHWLMKEPELEENDLRARAEGNRIVVERRALDDGPRAVEMVTPAEELKTLALTEAAPGLSRASVTVSEPGIYRFTDGLHRTVALVGAADQRELGDVRTTPEPLAGVAAASSGGVLWLTDLDRQPGGLGLRRPPPGRDLSGPGWIGLRANGAHIVTGISETPLLPALPLLLVLLAGLLATWRREGR